MSLLSILVPTKDRPAAAYKAIACAIYQSDSSTEIVVSDNSTKSYRGILKAKLERGGLLNKITLHEQQCVLPMHSNWEFLVENSQGDYVAILPDRWVPRQHAFDLIRRVIKSQKTDCVFWDSKLGLSDKGLIRSLGRDTPVISIQPINPSDQLSHILSFEGWSNNTVFTQPFPRGLNSVVSRALIRRIKSKVGSFFRPISCDYTSGISTLIECSRLLHIQESLYLSHGRKSNGAKSSIYGCRKGLKLTSEIEANIRFPDIDCVLSTVLHDILETLSLHGKTQYSANINLLNYYKSLVRELEFKMWNGSPLDVYGMLSDVQEICQANLGKSVANEISDLFNTCIPKYRYSRQILRRLNFFDTALVLKEKFSSTSNHVPYSEDDCLLNDLVYLQ